MALILAGNALGACASCPEITVLTWADYMDPELVDEFEKTFDVSVRFTYFATDDVRDEIMDRTNGQGIDVILVSGTFMDAYKRRGWIIPLDETTIPNRRHIDPSWHDAYRGGWSHGVPFFWGTLGIAYRADIVEIPIDSWQQLLQPDDILKGRLLMVRDAWELMSIALKTLGHSINTNDPKKLNEARALLMAQKPYVKIYDYDTMDTGSAMYNGLILAATMYSGDALVLNRLNKNIRFVHPSEGSIIWTDYLAVSQGSVNKELAAAFIDFLTIPQNAARLAEYLQYATPNKTAEALLPHEFRENPIIYPPKEVLDRSEVLRAPSARGTRFRNRTLAELLK